MSTSNPRHPSWNIGVLGGIPLLALALGTGDAPARSLAGCVGSGSVQVPTVRTQFHARGHHDVRRGGVRVEKRSGDVRIAPRPTSGGGRRGGVGALIGITFA